MSGEADLVIAEDREIVVVDGDQEVHVVVVEGEHFVISVGESGPRGEEGPAGTGAVELAFAWGDASPRTIETVTSGKLVYGVQLHIDTAFNGSGAELTVGDAADPDRLMAAAQNDPTAAGTYTSAPVHRYGADTAVLLTITPGAGASAGAGLLTLFIEQ